MVSGMGINGLIVFRIIYPALRWLGWTIVLLYVAIAVAVLGTRYVLFPKADHYKPYIETQLSALLGGRVELGQIDARWYRLNPHIEIEHFTLHDDHGVQVLNIPHLSSVVSWRSLFTGSPQFVTLQAAGIDLMVRRDSERHLWLLGRTVSDRNTDRSADHSNEASVGDRAMQWLISQPQIHLYDSMIRWIDETRDAVPLVLQDVSLKVRNQAHQHQFSLTARPAPDVGGSFDMRGNFLHSPADELPLALETGHGQVYVHIDDMHPEAWQSWVDWPAALHSERVSMSTWLEVRQGEPLGVTADVHASNASWYGADQQILSSGLARLYVAGPWQTFQDALLHDRRVTSLDMLSSFANSSRLDMLDFSVQAKDVQVTLPGLYEQPVVIDALTAQGSAERQQDGVALQLRDIAVRNQDIDLVGEMRWKPEPDSPGYVDARAQVRRAELSAVHRYMPRSTDDDVRRWLEQGLLAGQAHDVSVVVRGDISEFPFDDTAADGEFLIQGAYTGAVIDYVPSDEKNLGWPRLDAVHGQIGLDRVSLRIQADTGQIEPVEGAQVQLQNVDAFIANLRDDPILKVSGDTQGDAATYLAFLQHSDLSGLLGHVFDQSTAHGPWKMPLELTIPLTRSADTEVNGTIHIDGGNIQFDPQMPAFTTVNGHFDFTENDVSLTSLSARFLGGDVQLSGGVGPGKPGLRMIGNVDSETLSTLIDVPGMARFKGRAAYAATLKGVGSGSDIHGATLTVTSDLQGMALDFPPPLNKTSDAAWPLQIDWTHGNTGGARVLNVTLNNSMHARFLRHAEPSGDAYFDSGVLGVGREAQPIDAGLNVDIEHPVFDGDAWDVITREFSSSDDGDAERAVFPTVRSLRVQTAHGRLLGLPLDELTYTVKQLADAQWRADISSTQTAGTLTWQQENNQIQGPVQAVFHRLAYGDNSDKDDVTSEQQNESEQGSIDDDLRIPAINLVVENLSVYGRHVGELTLVGTNEDRGDIWRLEQFALSSPSAHLEGRGMWRLRGPQRGLTLDADVDVSDLGDYFDQIGFKDLLSAGEGNVQLEIDWHDLPWSLDVGKIDGSLNFEFTNGRLSTLNSKSARLLELISLQSVRRLATLDLNPLTLTEHGFPYDLLRGSLKLDHGQVHTEDYRIIGPVGTIVLDGLVHLKTGNLDLQAVVVPNLDVSGAAIAAGVAINPVVGIGAFLTQWLLKGPLATAMTAQYKIEGNWDEPEIQAVERIKGQVEGTADP